MLIPRNLHRDRGPRVLSNSIVQHICVLLFFWKVSFLSPLCNFFHIFDMVFHIQLPFYLFSSVSFLLSLDISLLYCDI